jgi:exopolysaccharide production protein ExoY
MPGRPIICAVHNRSVVAWHSQGRSTLIAKAPTPHPAKALLALHSSSLRADDGPTGGAAWPSLLTRACNVTAAAALVLLLSPLMLAVAWCIWREDRGPVLFAHWRVGAHGRLFRCFKFRSMVQRADLVLAELLARDDAARQEWARDHKLKNDPRVLRIGRFLRRTSLDELPQLLNVLRGEMNLVGPRPVVVQEIPRYGDYKLHYLSVTPGMTGLWQVSGRNNLSYDERVALDARYVETRSLLGDLRILLRTVRVVVRREGAC